MEDIPLGMQAATLAALILISGFFAMAETAMMASNRYRLRALASNGHHGAQRVLGLLGKTDKLLGVILLYNTLINAAVATLAGLISVQLFGDEKWVLGAATLSISFLILVFAEITPKVIGANYPDRLAIASALLLGWILRLSDPVISAINLLVVGMLRAMRLKTQNAGEEAQPLTPEELRSVIADSSHAIPAQHREILLNLFELENITVDDIMTPRGAVEAINISAPLDQIHQQLATSYHTRLPVYRDDLGNLLGILHQRRVLSHVLAGEWDQKDLESLLVDAYFIPAGTKIYSQLRFFQENRQRLGVVVDEYGEILGLVTLEDIIEEMIGKFTTSLPGANGQLNWAPDGSAIIEGSRNIRDINRALGLELPTDGPKTLNGLLLDHFEDIPEAGISVRIAGIAMDVVQTQDRAVKIVRLWQAAQHIPD